MNVYGVGTGILAALAASMAFLLPRQGQVTQRDGAPATVGAAALPADRPLVRLIPEFLDMSLEQLVQGATSVVIAHVESVTHVAAETGYPYEQYQIGIDETLTGVAKGSVSVHVLGGPSRAYDLEMAGAPSFAIGDRALLFLTKAPTVDYFGIYGLAQGVYRLSAGVDADYGSASGGHIGGDIPSVQLIGDVLDAASRLHAAAPPTPR